MANINNSTVINKIKQMSSRNEAIRSILKKISKTKIFEYVEKSQGDWRFIYYSVIWYMTSKLVPWRKIKLGNISFILPCDNWITHFRYYLFKNKEIEVIRFIDTYLDTGDVFYDIGANIGVYTLYSSKRHPGIKVYSFEPEYSNLHLLKQVILRNGITESVTPYGVAISDFDGLSMLHLQDTTPGAACHAESRSDIDKTGLGFSIVAKEGIYCTTIDTFSQSVNVVPNAIKIDTDGNEEKILRGAEKTLSDKRLRAVVIEMPGNPEDRKTCADLLEAGGLKCVFDEPVTCNQIWARV